MQKLSELDHEPVIGKFYLVPCVKARIAYEKYDYVPILNPSHEDSELIGSATYHRHYDIRFLSSKQIRIIQPGYALHAVFGAIIWEHHAKGEPEMRPLKCKRAMPLYPHARARWYPKLEAAYKDAKLSPCLRCPHKGIDLTTMPVREGKVECPGHGLRFDINTGELVPRTTMEGPR